MKGIEMSFTKKQREFLSAALTWGEKKSLPLSKLDKKDLQAIADSAGLKFPHWITRVPTYKVGRGIWTLPSLTETTVAVPTVAAAKPAVVESSEINDGVEATSPLAAPSTASPTPSVSPVVEMAKGTNGVGQSHIPAKDPLFVPFGSFTDMVSILKSEMFYPVFVTGLSGNGKTLMIDQACAKASRAMYRVNITIETDEDDLLGGFRLVDGETVWFDGPVVEAMRTGSVLLLDEVDLASTKIMCLQPILEGKGVFLKKINEYVDCQPGFNIVATANTKG
ncbi:MAG: AAA family ATPase, partial [Candidatus Pacebacteria bacterium]|nr:AAA family ATPase [Candidatus Paceibacterota bacterium]